MEKKYIMIIEKDAVISTALPKPLECPRCNKPYWVIWGAGDVVTVSNECKCTDQTPKIEKGVAELKQQGKDIMQIKNLMQQNRQNLMQQNLNRVCGK